MTEAFTESESPVELPLHSSKPQHLGSLALLPFSEEPSLLWLMDMAREKRRSHCGFALLFTMCCSKRRRRAHDPAIRVPIDDGFPRMYIPPATLDSAAGPVTSPKDNTPSLGSLLSKSRPTQRRQGTLTVEERGYPDQEAGMEGRRFGIELEPRR